MQRIKKLIRGIAGRAFLLGLAAAVVFMPSESRAENQPYTLVKPYYKADVTENGADKSTLTISLCTEERIDAGSFGIYLPANLVQSVKDVDNDGRDYSVYYVEKLEGDNAAEDGTSEKTQEYYFFSWALIDTQDRVIQEMPLISYEVNISKEEMLKKLAGNGEGKKEAGLLNFGTNSGKLYGYEPDSSVVLEIWDSKTGYYNGIYNTGSDGTMTVKNIGFNYGPADIGGGAITVSLLFYDPKDQANITLTPVKATLGLDSSDDDDTDDTLNFDTEPWNEEKGDMEDIHIGNGRGTGLYQQNITLSDIPDGSYEMTIVKKNHLPFTVKGISMAGQSLALGEITLVCGDVNGDGQTKLSDRNALLTYLSDGMADAGTEDLKKYDLNGDGSITVSDLNILMAPANYNKSGEDCILVIEQGGLR